MFSIGLISSIYWLFGIKNIIEDYNKNTDIDTEIDTESDTYADIDIDTDKYTGNLSNLEYIIGKLYNKYDKWSENDHKNIIYIINNIKNKKLKRCFKIMLEEYEEYKKK